MSDVTFSLAISHTPWKEERVESFARLRQQLDLYGYGDTDDRKPADERLYVYSSSEQMAGRTRWCHVNRCRVFDEKAPNHVWSGEMWKWGAAQETSHFVALQDDAVVSPDFWRVLHAMVLSKQDEVICLHAVHPAARAIAAEGFPWFTTTDGMVGVGYVLPRHLLQLFLNWRAELPLGAVEAITEDTLMGLWCMTTGRKVYHPVPTIVDHDTSLPSTYANDGHANRRPLARWDNLDIPTDELASTAHWLSGRRVIPHVGRLFNLTPLAARWCKANATEIRTYLGDNGAAELRRLNYARKGRGLKPPTRIFVGTPSRGLVHGEYAASVWRLLRHEEVELEDPIEVVDAQLWGSDVVRVRSRFVQYFLTQTDATHLLFVDADISFTPNCVLGMVRAGKDFVAAPYPRRDGLDWKRVRENPEVPPEAVAYRYHCHFLNGEMLFDEQTACAEVAAAPLGMALLSRSMLERMSAHYDALAFRDDGAGKNIPGIALFQLLLTDEGALLSEDYSFCRRWRDMGGSIHLYLGQGSPVNHWGDWGYKGSLEAFGMTREPK